MKCKSLYLINYGNKGDLQYPEPVKPDIDEDMQLS